MKLLSFILATGALMLGGCATTYQVQVSALADPELATGNRLFQFTQAEESKAEPGDLQYREVLRNLSGMLSAHGYVPAARSEVPGYTLLVDYGVGEPVTKTYTFATPVYAELGGGYTTRTKETKDAAGKVTKTSETVRVPGRYERVGTDVSINSVTTYRKYLQVSARLRQTGQSETRGPEAWTVTAVVDDERTDLRAALPLLVEAMAPYVGKDTHQAIVVEFTEKDGQFERVERR
uniref:hypothetical protein n=1 Tax=Cephaloticoccus sp. TaxID=1985742 RepID=UPI0040495CDB